MQEFLKETGNLQLYAPTWRLVDLLRLRQLFKPELPSAEVERLFTLFGGVPRSCVEMAGDAPAAEKSLKFATQARRKKSKHSKGGDSDRGFRGEAKEDVGGIPQPAHLLRVAMRGGIRERTAF